MQMVCLRWHEFCEKWNKSILRDNGANWVEILQNRQNPSSDKMMFKKIQKNNSGQLRHVLNKFTDSLKVLLLPLLDFID